MTWRVTQIADILDKLSLGALRTASGAASGSKNAQMEPLGHELISRTATVLSNTCFFITLWQMLGPIWAHTGFEGVSESHLFAKDQHEMMKVWSRKVTA